MEENFVESPRQWSMLFLAWVISLVAMLGSLFFSEVMEFPPCVLCWYQRICMYPLVLILFISLLKTKTGYLLNSMSLGLIGWCIALYHNLLYYEILPHSSSPCQRGISCTSVHIEWLGFITIPLLSLVAFSLILLILGFNLRFETLEKKHEV